MIEERLALREVYKSIGGKNILSNLSIVVGANEIVGLLGPNGAGKTTAFYIAAGLLIPDKGTVSIDNNKVTKLPMHMRCRVGLSYLPQEASIFQDLTVEENLNGIAELKISNKLNRKKFIDMVVTEFSL